MCLCSCANKEEMEVFKEALYRGYSDKRVAHSDLGKMAINGALNFTTTLQPLIVGGELVYGITSYGTKELIFVHDDDNYPIPENTDINAETLPVGLRKAAALETDIHLENVRRYHLADVDSYTNQYSPKAPYKVYHRSLQAEILSQTFMGRLWLRVLNIFDSILGWVKLNF